MRRRQLVSMSAAFGLAPFGALAATDPGTPQGRRTQDARDDDISTTRLVAAWRGADPSSPQRGGVLEADWQARTLHVRWEHELPTRAHGLAVDAHGIVVTSVRPGAWLLRLHLDGVVAARVRAPSSKGIEPRFAGHTVTSRDGKRLYATMTDLASGRGCIGVFDARTLEARDLWSSHGIEPHQLLLDDDGNLLVANGGIRRDAQDRKVDLDAMDSSLVHVDGRTGWLLGRWRLPDRRISLRHLAWSRPEPGAPALLGVAMQAEHDDATRRREAPGLAVWNGRELTVPTRDARAQGYAGDIAAAHDGGFVVSNHRTGEVLWWRPGEPHAWHVVAQLREAYALAGFARQSRTGTLVAAARGLGRWHPDSAPDMLPWPQVMALDNHWVWMEDHA